MYLRLLNSVTISLKQPFSKCGLQTLWVPNIVQGFDEVNTIKIIILLILRYHWPLYHVEMCTDGAKQWWGSTAGHWTHPTVVPSNGGVALLATEHIQQWYQAVVGQHCWPLDTSNSVPSYTHSHCHLYHNTLLAGKKHQFHLRLSLIKL